MTRVQTCHNACALCIKMHQIAPRFSFRGLSKAKRKLKLLLSLLMVFSITVHYFVMIRFNTKVAFTLQDTWAGVSGFRFKGFNNVEVVTSLVCRGKVKISNRVLDDISLQLQGY